MLQSLVIGILSPGLSTRMLSFLPHHSLIECRWQIFEFTLESGATYSIIAVHDVDPQSLLLGIQGDVLKCFTGTSISHLQWVWYSVFICWKKKKSAWNAFPEVGLTDTFLQLFADADINDTVVSVVECFLIIMYDRTTDVDDLNSARRHYFTKRSKSLELLPPTSDAFLQLIRRAVFQWMHIWDQSLNKQPLYLYVWWLGLGTTGW